MKFSSQKHTKVLFIGICMVLWNGALIAQVRLCSWNIQHLGKSKSSTEIDFIANTLRDFDIVAIQEVVAGKGGALAVARLVDELNRKGSKWDYVISEPTVSTLYASERYAYLWKTANVKRVRKAWLDQNYVKEIDREPFLMDFDYDGDVFTLVNFHAIPKKKQPETEIKYFKLLPNLYPNKSLVFLGDFNISQSHSVFNPLKKMNFKPVFVNQKTTMKMKCVSAGCLASEYDNIFYNSDTTEKLNSGVILIYKNFPNVKAVRKISDHIPIWAELDFSKTGNKMESLILRN